MASDFTNGAAVDNHDALRAAHGGERWAITTTVRPAIRLARARLDKHFGFRIQSEVASSRIRIGDSSAKPGDGDALALPADRRWRARRSWSHNPAAFPE